MSPAPKMVKTKTPGVFKRGARYVVVYRDSQGKQRKESARTYDLARQLKSTRDHEVASGSLDMGREIKFATFARVWSDEYRGKRNVIRPRTRRDYRRHLDDYVIGFFGETKKLADIIPRDVDRFVAWMIDGAGEEGRELSTSTIKRVLVPFRGFMEAARRDGLIVSNPVTGVTVPVRARVGGPKKAKALSLDEVKALLAEIPEEHRLFVEFLVSSGLRWSEAIAVERGDIDPDTCLLSIERSADPGRKVQATKSLPSVRQVRLSEDLVGRLVEASEGRGPTDLLFADEDGKMLAYPFMREEVLIPAARRAGLPYSGFHALRHTAASLLFASGRNVKEVQEFLGHANPGFTLTTYIHLLRDSERPVVKLDTAAQ
jgi:integrase